MKLNERYLSDVEEQVFTLTRAKKAAGTKVVGVYCAFTPKEIILAAGGIPVALCGGSNEPIAAAERHLPRNLCPLVKSSYGFALTDTCPNFHLADVLVADATCDGKKKMYELLSGIKPVHLLQLPQTGDAQSAHDYWLQELYRLKELLEHELGTEITAEKLKAAIKLCNEVRAVRRQVFELNRGDVPMLTGQEIDIALDPGGPEVDLPGYISRLQEVIQFAHRRGGIRPRPRIMLTGCPVTSKKVLNIIEETALVVAMENCGGLKTAVAEVDNEGDPMEALAAAYLKIACPCMSPNQRRFELIAELIKAYRIDGVVDLTWHACHTYNVESFSLGKYTREELGVPFLQLETDYSQNDVDWIKVRVEAFLEML